MTQKHKLGDLQLAIMRVLWRMDEAPVTEVHGALLEERGLAATTIATMLVKMEKKGVVTHRLDGRRYIYRATASESEVRTTMVGDITNRLFQGSAAALVSHLIEERQVTPEELRQLRALMAEHDTKENQR